MQGNKLKITPTAFKENSIINNHNINEHFEHSAISEQLVKEDYPLKYEGVEIEVIK